MLAIRDRCVAKLCAAIILCSEGACVGYFYMRTRPNVLLLLVAGILQESRLNALVIFGNFLRLLPRFLFGGHAGRSSCSCVHMRMVDS